MNDLPSLMKRIRATKQERKELNLIVRDTLAASGAYQKMLDELKELRIKKQRLEREIKQECTQEMEKVEKLAQSLKADNQLLTDLALTKFMKGETIEIIDENDVKYEPVFKVLFKRMG